MSESHPASNPDAPPPPHLIVQMLSSSCKHVRNRQSTAAFFMCDQMSRPNSLQFMSFTSCLSDRMEKRLDEKQRNVPFAFQSFAMKQ